MIVGVDGCRAGWIAVWQTADGGFDRAVFPDFCKLVDGFSENATIVVDMPVGLPDISTRGGRGPEPLVRAKLGERQSSVFSVPSRAAVYATDARFVSLPEWYINHRKASEVARVTSDPPRAVSIQCFALFPKIVEIDQLLRDRPELRDRIHESHPEVAFWKLNGDSAMTNPKKIKGRINPAGIAERRDLLERCGVARAFLDAAPPKGAGEDDYLDATAMMLVAGRIRDNVAIRFPDPPQVDGYGLRIAIWA